MVRVLMLAGDAGSLINFRGQLIQDMLSRNCVVVACAAPNDEAAIKLRQWGAIFQPIKFGRASVNPFEDIFLFLRFYRLCRSVNPDIVLAYTIKPVVYGLLAAKLARIKHAYALITGLGFAFLAKGFRGFVMRRIAIFLYKIALRNISCVFFQNPDDCNYFSEKNIVSKTQDSTILNGSGVDLQYFLPVPLQQQPIFLLIARLLSDKGIREYAAAAKVIKYKYPEAIFQLAGGLDDNPAGLKMQEVQSWVDSGTLQYLGKLRDVRIALAGCSVFVLPSYREGTPRAVLEAMAMGRPVITTDAPGCRETVEDGVNGFLVPVKDISGLAQAMERLVKDQEMRATMGAASRRRAVEKYDVHHVNAQMLRKMGLHETHA